MQEITVKDKEKLELAIKDKYDVIYIVGDLGENLKNTEQLKKMSGPVLGLLIGIVMATPFSFGVSTIALVGVNAAVVAAGGSAISLGTLTAIIAIGATNVFDIYKNYSVDISCFGDGYKATLFLKETFDKLKDKVKE